MSERGRHEGEWLLPAPLALAQVPDRLRAGRVHHQMKPAQSLDGDDLSHTDGLDCRQEGVVASAQHLSVAIPQGE